MPGGLDDQCCPGAGPANDNFASALVITNSTGTTNGSNAGATMEACELPFIMGDDFADMDNSVWFAWTAPSNGIAEFDTAGSDFDTVLAVFTTPTGLCDTNIAYVAENDDVTNGVQLTSQTSFYVVRRQHLLHFRERERGHRLSFRQWRLRAQLEPATRAGQ